MGLGLRLWKRAGKYDRLLGRGDHQLLTAILIKALELKADAICFGFRPDIVGFREGGDEGGQCAEQMADLAKFFAEDPGGLRGRGRGSKHDLLQGRDPHVHAN